MNVCPVFIEHVPKLIAMRRHLVMEKAEFPPELLNLFENTEQRFNPWGIAPGERVKWAQEHEVRVLADDTKVDYLFFVGCSGALDSRNRQTSLALAKIFNRAGLSWGILGSQREVLRRSPAAPGQRVRFRPAGPRKRPMLQKTRHPPGHHVLPPLFQHAEERLRAIRSRLRSGSPHAVHCRPD